MARKKRKKKKRGASKFFVTLSILLMIGAGTGILWLLYNYMPTGGAAPEEILESYVKSINGKRYNAMYDFVHDSVKEEVAQENFVNRNKRIYEGIGAAHVQIVIHDVQEKNDAVTITYQMTMQTMVGEISFTNAVDMKLDKNEEYRIVWNDSLIFPELTKEDKVRYRTLNPSRGNIYDRHQNAIAIVENGYEIGIVPADLGVDRTEALNQIAAILGETVESIEAKLNAEWVEDTSVVPILMMSGDYGAMVDPLTTVAGIQINETKVRKYPYGAVMGHITGYVQNISEEELAQRAGQGYNIHSVIGKSGVEKAYEERLRGVAGSQICIVDSEEQIKSVLAVIEPQNGEDITLTVDGDMQRFMYEQLAGESGFSVVMDSQVGEVLVMVSTPSYDPNEFVLGISTPRWNELSENEANPLYNRVTGTWRPGSVFKSVIGGVGTTVGIIDPAKTTWDMQSRWQKNESWGDFHITTTVPYSAVNLCNALVYSDNIYFAKKTLEMGADTLREQLIALGFLEAVPFDVPMIASTFGTDEDLQIEQQLANSGYGQGDILVNPIHLASIYSAFANEGNMVTPYLEYREEKQQHIWKSQVFSAVAAQTVLEDMIQVVERHDGTASAARVNGVTIAGKTGTAELKETYEEQNGRELGWMAAIHLKDGGSNLLNITMIEDVQDKGGSSYTATKVRAFFEVYQ